MKKQVRQTVIKQTAYEVSQKEVPSVLGISPEGLFGWLLKHYSPAVTKDLLPGIQDVPSKAKVEKMQNKALI